jgi:hypothetical protein
MGNFFNTTTSQEIQPSLEQCMYQISLQNEIPQELAQYKQQILNARMAQQITNAQNEQFQNEQIQNFQNLYNNEINNNLNTFNIVSIAIIFICIYILLNNDL